MLLRPCWKGRDARTVLSVQPLDLAEEKPVFDHVVVRLVPRGRGGKTGPGEFGQRGNPQPVGYERYITQNRRAEQHFDREERGKRH